MELRPDIDRPRSLPDSTWEQWCVLSVRPYVKFTPDPVRGQLIRQECLLNEKNCRQILTNFRDSKDDLPATQKHDKGEALAFHNAMVLVIGGRIVDMASHDPALAMPTLNDLPRSDRGEPPEDGIYVHRYEITPPGLPKVGVTLKKLSPEFFTQGRNEHGDSIGYVAEGSTYTNYPFLTGNEAQYEAAGLWHLEKKTMDEQANVSPEEVAMMMQKAGIAPGDDQQTTMMKFCRMMKMSTEAPAAVPGQPAAKPPAGPAVQMEQLPVPAVSGQAPPSNASAAPNPATSDVDDPKRQPAGENGPPGANGMQMERVMRTVQNQAAIIADLQKRDQARTAKEQRTEADLFVFEKGQAGQIRPRSNETWEQACTRVGNLFQRYGKDAAEAALADPGTYPAPQGMMVEFTRGGKPFGWNDPVPQGIQMGERPDQALDRLVRERVKSKGVEGKPGAYSAALEEIKMERGNTVLFDAYQRNIDRLSPIGQAQG